MPYRLCRLSGQNGVRSIHTTEPLIRYFENQQTIDILHGQYKQLLEHSADLRAQLALQYPDGRVISSALPSTETNNPRIYSILLLAGLAGLGLGVGIALLQENLVGGFLTEAQLSSVAKIPVAGTVPLHLTSESLHAVPDILHLAPLSMFAESLRRVRAVVDQHLSRTYVSQSRAVSSQGKVIAVGSSVHGEGNTTIAYSLARTYAQAGKRTLLIDGNLRFPEVHYNLGVHSEVGLIDYLLGEKSKSALASLILPDKQDGLSILVGSYPPDIPTDQLISGAAFEHLMKVAIENFDIVILDTPPILPIVDGLYLLRHADILLFLVRWSSTAQSCTRRALDRISQAQKPNMPILGLINQNSQPSF